jgi:hypothetical protein
MNSLNSIYASTMWYPPAQKAQNAADLCKPRFLRKAWTHPPCKVALFTGHEISYDRDNKPQLKFHMKKLVLSVYRVMLRLLNFG